MPPSHSPADAPRPASRGTVAELEASEQAHRADPERADMLRRARLFKTGWLELAEALVRARKKRSYEAWGYASFEDYTKKELRLRQETVDKLTGSFLFLKERAPDVMERDGLTQKIPSYDSVDFLRRAEERHDAPPEVMDELRKKVLEHPVSMPTLSKHFAPTIFPPSEPDRVAREKASMKAAAERLRDALTESRSAPMGLAGDLITLLERLLATLEVGE
ncbi:MAG: hypothetical protein IPF92_11635 [Myxococcales bacterium]|jgi:hypothetical protein|nr:hypothetical protein [Myxococcales bacterium]MBL0198271.1 hypothetical protein [Myxococcales bacterium]HQY65467.1 hypothetical protein [Polyangiaceae bacterium]